MRGFKRPFLMFWYLWVQEATVWGSEFGHEAAHVYWLAVGNSVGAAAGTRIADRRWLSVGCDAVLSYAWAWGQC